MILIILFLGVKHHCKTDEARKLLLTEMIARILKEEMNMKLRQTLQESKLPLKMPFRSAVVKFINQFMVSTESEESIEELKIFWKDTLKKLLSTKFQFSLEGMESSRRYDLRKEVDPILLFSRFQDLTSITISPQLLSELDGAENLQSVRFAVIPSDIIAVGAKVKHLNVIDEAEAKMLMYQAIHSSASRAASLWKTVNRKFEAAMSSNTASYKTLIEWASSLLHQAQQQLDHDEAFELLNSALEKAKTAVSKLNINIILFVLTYFL